MDEKSKFNSGWKNRNFPFARKKAFRISFYEGLFINNNSVSHISSPLSDSHGSGFYWFSAVLKARSKFPFRPPTAVLTFGTKKWFSKIFKTSIFGHWTKKDSQKVKER